MGAPAPPGAPATRGEVALWIAFLLLVATFGYRRFESTDTAVHILAGREILASKRIPDSDPFSFTVPGAPWFVNQWIPEIVFAVVENVAGIAGLTWLRVVLLVATFAVLARAARGDPRSARAPLPAALAALLLALVAPHNLFIVRPLLFSCLFLAVEVLVLEEYRRGRDRLLLLPPLFAVWVNCHAGFVLGAIVFAATLAGEAGKALAAGRLGAPLARPRIARLAAVFAAALAFSVASASLANPRGFATVLLPFGLLKSDFFLSVIGEYSPAAAPDWLFFVMLALLVLGFVRSVVGARRSPDLTDWLTTLPIAYQAWRTHRIILFFAIAAAPALARGLALLGGDAARIVGDAARIVGRAARARAAAPWVAAAGLVAACGARAASDPLFGTGLSYITYPRPACLRFLEEERLEPNLFHNDLWAGAVALFGWPRYRLFIDGRLEVYGESFWRDVYFRILGCGPGWEEALARYGVNAALLRAGSVGRRDRIGSVLRAHPDWALVYWDETAMLYVRRIPAHADVIARHGVPPDVDPEDLRVPGDAAGRARFAAAMDRALAADPGSVAALYGAVTAALADPDAGGAARAARYLPLLRDAMRERLGRRDWRLPWLEGRILLAGGDAEGAARALARAERAPGGRSEEVLLDRVEAEARRGRGSAADAAISRGVRAAERRPGLAEAEAARAAGRFAFLAARALARAGDGERARAAYSLALARDPSRREYATARAWSFVLEGRYAEAARAADEGLARFPGDPYLLDTRGWALFHAGRAREAEADLRAMLAALPAGDAAARAAGSAHLGEVLLAGGGDAARAEARALLESAASDPALGDMAEVARARALIDSLERAAPPR
jgi:tetratricopeptide (TPR) repeat protein